MRSRRWSGFGLTLLLVIGLAGCGPAGTTTRMSVDSDEQQLSAHNVRPSMSDDGNLIAFDSSIQQVRLRNRSEGTTVRVDVSSSEVAGNSFGSAPSMSGNGRFVVFHSSATNLVAPDANGFDNDVFIRDLQAGTTELVSLSSSETQGNDASTFASVSSDGRYVVFDSAATNLVAGDTNGKRDVFLRDRQAGTTIRVSLRSNGAQSDGESTQPAVSADGTVVAFFSYAALTTGAPTTGSIFVRSLSGTATTTLMSFGSGGTGFGWPDLTDDGRYVLFNAREGGTGTVSSTWVRDRSDNSIDRVSVSSSEVAANKAVTSASFSRSVAISSDGRYAVFGTEANNLGGPESLGKVDVFVRDLVGGTTTKASVTSSGAEADDSSGAGGVAVSTNGRYTAFESRAKNLAGSDTNGTSDVYLRDRGN